MKKAMTVTTTSLLTLLSGCAGLDFGEGLSYNEPTPYLFVTVSKDCVSTATVISLPGEKKAVKFERGYGSADLSVELSNGILTKVGQKTDSKIPETITSIASLGTAMAALSGDKSVAKQVVCDPSATLYTVSNGVPDLSAPLVFPVASKIIDGAAQ
jgi:hypothetical protein